MRLVKVREGKTDLMVPDPEFYAVQGRFEPSKAPVFYNPKMEFSRDMAVLVLRVFSKSRIRPLEVCDPLTGLGARGVRFAKEVTGIGKVVVGDLNDDALPIIEENVHINEADSLVEINHKDACLLLEEHAEPGKRFDYIDVDPFGTPSPFLDTSVRALKNGGIMAITATDTAPLCGVYNKACFRKYGGISIKSEFCHEIGLRIMVGTAVREALKYDFGIEVLLSYSVDHYFRAYLKGSLGAKKGDASAADMGYIFYCNSCGWRGAFRLADSWPCSCPSCGGALKRGGPLWCGSLGSTAYLEKILNEDRSSLGTSKRLEKLLKLLIMENGMPPTYYVVDNIASRLKRDVPPLLVVLEKLDELGFKASQTHFHPKALKTSAPLDVLTAVVKQSGRVAKN